MGERIKHLFKDGFFHILGSSFINKCIAFITNIILVRILSKNDFGVFTGAFNALLKTFGKRDYYGNPFVAIDLIRDSELIRARWKNYQRKYEYAKDIDFDDILDCIIKMMEQMDPVVV